MSLCKTEAFVVLIGTKGGPAIRPRSPMPTSNLLQFGDSSCVVDCGLGVTRGLVDTGFELKNLHRIFITHLHSDHYLELGPLLHTAWTAGLDKQVEVYGPSGLDKYMDAFLQSMEADIALRIEDEGRPDLKKVVQVHILDEGVVLKDETMTVEAMRNLHPPLTETFALKFEYADKRVVFSGDTAPLAKLPEFAHDADLLIHEAMLPDGIEALARRVGNGDDRLIRHLERSHSSAQEVGVLASNARVKHLAINHLIPSDDPDYGEAHWVSALRETWAGELTIGKDGIRIPF